jgi:hypothetical protein
MSEQNIQSESNVAGPASYISIEPITAQPKETEKGISGASSIKKSEEQAAEEMIASMNTPMLMPPADNALNVSNSASAIALIGDNTIGQINNDIWKKYQQNLDQIKEQIEKQIASPTYQALQEIRIHGGDTANVSGLQTALAANAALANPIASGNFSIINSVENLHHNMTRVSPAETDVTQMMIPMTTTLLIAGVPAIATMEFSAASSNPVQGSLEIIGKLQQNLPALGLQDVVPMINLMVMAPIYYNALTEATSRLPNKEQSSHVGAAQKFAQSVIAMVSNPDYIMVNFVNKMEGADKMSPDRKQEIASSIRLILATVALSLLYSIQTGKVQGSNFWGITPQELRDMLNGTMAAPDPDSKPTEIDKLSATLINLAQAQLASLPMAQRLSTINNILNFVTANQSIKTMLDPVKILSSVIDSANFDEEQKLNEEKKV